MYFYFQPLFLRIIYTSISKNRCFKKLILMLKKNYSFRVMFVKIAKTKLFEFFIENKKSISSTLLEKVFIYLCEQENCSFEYSPSVMKKLKSSLVMMKKSWESINRKGQKIRKCFLAQYEKTHVELEVKLKIITCPMEIDSTPFENLFEHLNIH